MKCERIKPAAPAYVPTPQCCAKVPGIPTKYHLVSGYWERRKEEAALYGWDPALCMLSSSWNINGKMMCSKHAGMEALKILSKKKG